ncbi:Clp protease proteolytic subunit /Translocation-enhancing protein TepA protein [Raphanus sativus]|nr:Clp protease proteolytic subunit /Translocation-enhancing protein TepA protein [Raphanus sativus]
MQDFKNVPQYFYGLSPAQMDMFMTEDSPVRRQAEKESLSSRRNCLDNGGIWSMSGMNVADPRRLALVSKCTEVEEDLQDQELLLLICLLCSWMLGYATLADKPFISK